MELRRAAPGDAALLHDVAAATFPLACPPDAPAADVAAFIAANLSVEAFEGYLASDAHDIVVAVEGERAVGYVMTVAGEPSDPDVAAALRHRPTVEVSKIYVRPELHGRGLASRLMDAAVEIAKGRGASSVWLGVNQHNARANAFYERSGFARVGVKSFQLGTRLENDFVRERALASSPR